MQTTLPTDEARILRDATRRYAEQTIGADRATAEQMSAVVPDDLTGDALRLAVKLRLVVHVWDDDGESTSVAKTLPGGDDPSDESDAWFLEADPSDRFSATRRAIVRAAAEIGKAAK
jgi:hypothetical protein